MEAVDFQQHQSVVMQSSIILCPFPLHINPLNKITSSESIIQIFPPSFDRPKDCYTVQYVSSK